MEITSTLVVSRAKGLMSREQVPLTVGTVTGTTAARARGRARRAAMICILDGCVEGLVVGNEWVEELLMGE